MMFWNKKTEVKEPLKKPYLTDLWTTSAIREGLDRLISLSMQLPQDRGGYDIDYLSSRSGIDEKLVHDLMPQLCHMGLYRRDENGHYEPKYTTSNTIPESV